MRARNLTGLLALAMSGMVAAQDLAADDERDGLQPRLVTPANGSGESNGPISNPQKSETSPVQGINRRQPRPDRPGPQEPRDPGNQSFDGSTNNLLNPEMGAAHSHLERLVPAAYADGVDTMAETGRPGPRVISNAVHAQSQSVVNSRGYSDFLWQWGQFLDHDIDLTDGVDPPEPAPISVPAGDEYFDPQGSGTVTINFNRSLYDKATGTGADNPRQQINEISGWIDASNVYGSDEERARALRRLDGSGKLKSSEDDLLPFNVAGLPNAGGPGEHLFVAGDVRANEQVGLTVMHTLFMREHNRLADEFAEANPESSGEEIFNAARRQVIALMQVITYNEFLPALLGADAIPAYEGYNNSTDADISNVFSAAAYRLGHTMLSPTLLRLDADGGEGKFGHLSLADAFFRPDRLTDEGGIESILRGLAAQVCQDVDVYVVDEVRNFLFGLPGSGGFDLASLNIQRGRDHGLATYAQARRALGLPPVRGFVQVTQDLAVAQRLASVYSNVGQMDIWTAGLAEDAVAGGLLGPLFRAILIEQFQALRDGDRFWYQRMFRGRDLRRLENTRLSDIIRRNTSIGDEIQDNVFVAN